MQTTKIVYLVMWILFLTPLLAFNIKRMTAKNPEGHRRIKWPFLIFISALCILLSVFLFSAYKATLFTRYELTAERYIDLHGEYLTGQITFDEYMSRSESLRTPDFDTTSLQAELSLDSGNTLSSVRFQFGNSVIPKYFKEWSDFPSTEVLGAENPIFLFYTMDTGTKAHYFLLEMRWDDQKGWQIAYHAKATQAQVDVASKKDYLPKQNGKWMHINS